MELPFNRTAHRRGRLPGLYKRIRMSTKKRGEGHALISDRQIGFLSSLIDFIRRVYYSSIQ